MYNYNILNVSLLFQKLIYVNKKICTCIIYKNVTLRLNNIITPLIRIRSETYGAYDTEPGTIYFGFFNQGYCLEYLVSSKNKMVGREIGNRCVVW